MGYKDIDTTPRSHNTKRDLNEGAPKKVTVSAVDGHGNTYVTSGKDRKEAGRSMAHHIARGTVPAGSTVSSDAKRNLGRQFH